MSNGLAKRSGRRADEVPWSSVEGEKDEVIPTNDCIPNEEDSPWYRSLGVFPLVCTTAIRQGKLLVFQRFLGLYVDLFIEHATAVDKSCRNPHETFGRHSKREHSEETILDRFLVVFLVCERDKGTRCPTRSNYGGAGVSNGGTA